MVGFVSGKEALHHWGSHMTMKVACIPSKQKVEVDAVVAELAALQHVAMTVAGWNGNTAIVEEFRVWDMVMSEVARQVMPATTSLISQQTPDISDIFSLLLAEHRGAEESALQVHTGCNERGILLDRVTHPRCYTAACVLKRLFLGSM